jgi:hypothetical protein
MRRSQNVRNGKAFRSTRQSFADTLTLSARHLLRYRCGHGSAQLPADICGRLLLLEELFAPPALRGVPGTTRP